MTYRYATQGVCSREMVIELSDDKKIVKSLRIVGGCPGNTLGLSRLVENMPVEEVISRLEGIRCGAKPTSCPDQLATALKAILAEK